LHHPFEADVAAQFDSADSFAEIFWADKIAPFVGSASEELAKQGVVGDLIYRCPNDESPRYPFVDETANIHGVANRVSYLMNSLTSHMSRRYGKWTLQRFSNEVGTSKWISFSERNGDAFKPEDDNDPRQDDYDIWLGTKIFGPWLATERHGGVASYLYLDGHVVSAKFEDVVIDMFPDRIVLEEDGSYID
jgi:prepilin-type processing-associated H-X9-DG protein